MSTFVATAKRTAWRYFGAMMMERKDGILAVSYTRTLGIILFFCCLGAWGYGIFFADKDFPGIPDGMLYTLWGLIGIKGLKDSMLALRGE